MFWADKIAASSQQPELVNDSKTPSGRVHVGSLRGVIIHDVIYRALKRQGKPARFTYGVDDYDPLDTVPRYLDAEKFSPYLGFPLCNVPSPDPTVAPDYAKYYMGEFLQVFDYLGVKAEIYYLRDLYREGKLNYYIDLFLRNAAVIREIYKEVSNAQRPDDWYPFQVICENCGRIATTYVSKYDGERVFYTCREDATDWVKGCGYQGWISPFNGNGKLPWKVEWVAKWDLLGVTIEMSGKDHSQKGGSRDVANAICRKILKKKPPFHSPYEFILVNGTKMSSSKGIGSSAKEMADLLPPEILRFLMLRTQPKTVINFAPNYETITRLFRDYDALLNQYVDLLAKGEISELPPTLLPLYYSQLEDEIKPYYTFELSTIISLLQIPHLDLKAEIEKRCDRPLTDYDWQKINERIDVAKKWLESYADEEEKLVIYFDQIPEKVSLLTDEQKQYLRRLREYLETVNRWEGEELQTALFTVTKEMGISPNVAFPAVYYAFLGKDKGPKAGYLFSYLDKNFVFKRLEEVSSL